MLRLSWIALRAVSASNRLFLRRFTLAGRVLGALLVAAAVLGVDTERSMTFQMFTLAAALFVVAFPFLFRFRPRLAVTRLLPALATAGQPCAYRLRLENRDVRAHAGLLIEEVLGDPRPSLAEFLRAGAPPHARSFVERHSVYARWRWLIARRGPPVTETLTIATLPPGQAAELEAKFTPQRRGMLHFESVVLSRPDPLGLLKACRDLPAGQNLCVVPRRYRLPRIALPGARRYQQGGLALATSVGDSEEFVSLRDYRPGDPLKRIHWRSFARLGKPVVKEYQDEYFERHCLVLDTFAGAARERQFEEAVSVAASFVCAIETQECLLDLLFVGDRPYVFTSGRGLLKTERLLELLATVEPGVNGSFEALTATLIERRALLASTILLFAAWDRPRQEFCERLVALGLSLIAFAVLDESEPLPARPGWLRTLRVGHIEADLARSFP